MKKIANSFNLLNVPYTKYLMNPVFLIVSALFFNSAKAATLGPMKVLSTFGKKLNAQIELSNVLPQEQANLTATIASSDVFKRAGLEYNPLLSSVKVTIHTQTHPFKIILTSQVPISEPLLELLIDLNWRSGHVVRQYTVLLDLDSSLEHNTNRVDTINNPLNNVPAAAPQIIGSNFLKKTPVLSTESIVDKPLKKTEDFHNTQPNNSLTTNKQIQNKQIQDNLAKNDIQNTVNDKKIPTGSTYSVKKGDTLYAITKQLIQNNPSNDLQINQLMGLLVKNNPHSFIQRDKNRLKSGVVLNLNAVQNFIPDSKKVEQNQVQKILNSKKFTAYKQAAAKYAKITKKDSTVSKTVYNSINTQIAKPINTLQDQLKVSGNAALNKNKVATSIKMEEFKISQDRAKIEEKTKLELLKKNVQSGISITNNALAGMTNPSNIHKNHSNNAQTGINKQDQSVSNQNTPVVATVSPYSNPSLSTSNTETTRNIISSNNATNQSSHLKSDLTDISNLEDSDLSADSAPLSNNTPNLLDPSIKDSLAINNQDLTKPMVNLNNTNPTNNTVSDRMSSLFTDWFNKNNVLLFGGIAGLLGLIGLLLWRKKQNSVQEISQTQFNSFDTQGTLLTVDGGQSVDTLSSAFSSTLANINPSESSELDPVAEAEVYIQYGRDSHAEEILKDALSQSPNSIPIHLKLMELYSKKKDYSNLKAHADSIATLTHSSGSDWQQANTILNQLPVKIDSVIPSVDKVSIVNTVSNTNFTSTPSTVPSKSFQSTRLKDTHAALNNVHKHTKSSLSNFKNTYTNTANKTNNQSNFMALKTTFPDINLSTPTHIGDVLTAINMESPIHKIDKPIHNQTDTSLNIVTHNNFDKPLNINLNDHLNSKDPVNIQALKLDNPVSLIQTGKIEHSLTEAALQQGSVNKSVLANSIHFDVQTPTLIAPQTVNSTLNPVALQDKTAQPLLNNTNTPINSKTLNSFSQNKQLNTLNSTNYRSQPIQSMDKLSLSSKISQPIDVLNINAILEKITNSSGQANTINMSSDVKALETKLNLAQAYLEIGDKDGAKELLNEVLRAGHQTLSEQAKVILSKL